MTTPPPEYDALGRAKLTLGRRVDLLEHDRHQQSRMITKLVDKVGKGFTDQQLAQIRAVFREELADAGIRLDSADHQDEAREDFRFLRRLRLGMDGTASKIGWLVIAAIVGGFIWLVNLGLNTWKV